MKPELITSIKAQLGEGPFWHDKALYWADILGKKIYRHFPKEDKTEEMQLDQYVGALAPREKGGFAITQSKVARLSPVKKAGSRSVSPRTI